MTRTTTQTLEWLVNESRNLCAIREVEKLYGAMVDGLINLCGAERGYMFLGGAGPKNLLAVSARGAGGLVAPAPDRRAVRAAERALGDMRTVHLLGDGTTIKSACTALTLNGELQGILYVDGQLQEDGAQSHFIDLFAQVAAVALDNARFFERSSNDLLTGLPNHSFFTEALARAVRAQHEGGGQSGLLLLDLDSFRRVNRAAGAEIGDRALIDVAQTLRDTLCADGLVARFGSDSFAVLLSGASTTQVQLRLHDVAERARAAVNAKIFAGVQLSGCIGAAPLAAVQEGGVAQAVRTTLALCESLLQAAQTKGPGHIEVFRPATD